LEKEKKDAAKRAKEEEEQKEIDEQLRVALATHSRKGKAAKAKKAAAAVSERRWESVREAWEIVKDEDETAGSTETPVPEVVVDGRDRVDGDVGGHDARAAHDFLEGLEEQVRKVTHATHEPAPGSSQHRPESVGSVNVDTRTAEERREAVAKAWKSAPGADRGERASQRAASSKSGDVAQSSRESMSVPHSTYAAVR